AAIASATARAVAVSPQPTARPRAILAAAARAEALATPAPAPQTPTQAQPEPIDEPEPVSGASGAATPTSVARQATQTDALDLGGLSLVGLFGSSGSRRALVLLGSGRFQTVEVGDRLDGGKVVAISETQLSYVKGSKTIVLKLLSNN
ncbi:MAG: hypothetical protein Q8O82_04785, partial [Pseudorhodobacter sp.]|nr:hypothetical protein [Pseudorhodobacter sp.]